MSVFQNLYLGPYAMFTLSPGVESLPEDEDGETIGWRHFRIHSDGERAYFMPRGAAEDAPKSAPRAMYYGGDPGWPWEPGLLGISPGDEVGWLTKEYAAELAEVGAAIGLQPAFGWGLLSWVHA